MSPAPALLRASRWRSLALLSLAGAVLASAALVLLPQIAGVRGLVRRQLERLLDDICAGDVQLDRIVALSLAGVTVEGVTVRDPAGRTVLRAKRLQLGLDPRALLGLNLRFTHGLLEDARIRAIPSEDLAITLFDALAPPATDAPSAPGAGSPLDVAFEHIHVTHAHLYGDVPGLSELEVVGLDARGDIRIADGELAVRVSSVRGDLVRPFGHALSLTHGTFALDTSPVRMRLKARVARATDRVHVALTYRAAPEGMDGSDHLDLLLALEPVSPDLLLDLGIAPAQILLSDLRGHARLSGPLTNLSFALALDTDAGPIAVRGRVPEAGDTEVQIRTGQIALEQLIGYAPPLTMTAEIDVRAASDGVVQLHLRAPSIALFGIELRHAELSGVYRDERLSVDRARILFGGGRFDLSGWVDSAGDLSLRVRSRVPEIADDPVVRSTGLSGALRTDLRIERRDEELAIDGSVGIERFGLDDLTAKEIVIEGRVSADETLSAIRLDVSGASWGTAYYGYPIGDIVYEARGKTPKFVADFELLDFFGRTAKARLALTQRGDSYHVLLSPLELGVPDREPWRAKADLTFHPGGIAFHQVFLANGPQRLELAGAYSYTKSYRVDAKLQSFDLGGLRTLLGLDLADLDGTVDGKLALTGVPGHPRIDAQGSLHSGVFLGMEDLTVMLSLVSVDERFDIDTELVLPDRSRIAIYAGGEPGPGATWMAQIASGNYQFGLDFESVPLSVTAPWLGWLGITPPPGKVSAMVRGAGSLSAPYLEVESKVEGLELEGYPALDIEGEVVHDGKRVTLRKLSVADPRGQIATLEGFLEARPDELLDPIALRASLGTRPLELTMAWSNRRLDELPGPLRVNLPMPTTGALRVAQTDAGPSLELTTQLGWSEETEGLDACGAYRHPQLELSLQAHDLRTTAKLRASLDGEQLAMADLEAATPVVGWITGSEPLYLPRASFTLDASTEASEEVPGLCEYVAGPLRVEISALDAFADPPELRFSVRSTGLQLVAHASQRQRLGMLRAARATGRPFALMGSGNVEGASFHFQGALDQGDGSELRVELSIPRALVQDPEGDRSAWPPLHAKLQANRLELASILIGLPGSVRGSGLVEGGADVRYDFPSESISMSGALWLREGKLVLGALGQELSEVSGRMILRDDTIRLEKLEARDFDGRIDVDGSFTLRGAEELRTELALMMRDFPIRRESAQVSRVTGTMELRATTTRERTLAELTFGDVRVNLPNDLGQGLQSLSEHPDIVVRGVEQEEPDADPHTFELHVLAKDPPFRVLRSDLSAEIAADLLLRHRAPVTTLSGSAEIKRGSFEVYGKRFELGDSRLAFDGGEEIDPLVSLDAVHRTGGDQIGIHVGGRVSDPTITFTHSNPAITEPGDIIAQLLGARSTDPARQQTSQQGASGAAASILAGATAGLLTKEVRDELGGALPVLSLESRTQLRAARIRAGVQLDQLIERRLGPLRHVVRGAYVEGFVAPGASADATNTSTIPQSRGGGLLELRFPKDLVGTIEFRPIQNWRLDLAWEP